MRTLWKKLTAILLLMVGALNLAGPAVSQDSADRANPQRTFVLVHGAWVGGWTWDGIRSRLEAAGHTVYAPTLTGLAERSHLLGPDVNRSTHVADITTLIEFEGLTDIVLVGHSYGGLVISDVAQALPEGTIGSIVYLDALMPPFPAEGVPALEELEEVDGTYPPLPLEAFGYVGEMKDIFTRPQTAMPAGTLDQEVVPTPKVAKIPRKMYIFATNSGIEALRYYYESVRSDPAWTTHEIETLHDVMLSEPEMLTEMLLEAAE